MQVEKETKRRMNKEKQEEVCFFLHFRLFCLCLSLRFLDLDDIIFDFAFLRSGLFSSSSLSENVQGTLNVFHEVRNAGREDYRVAF